MVNGDRFVLIALSRGPIKSLSKISFRIHFKDSNFFASWMSSFFCIAFH